MKDQKCANCGYRMGAGESIFANVSKVLGDVFGKGRGANEHVLHKY